VTAGLRAQAASVNAAAPIGSARTSEPEASAQPRWTWWREASGSVADLGVLVPIAVALIVGNGLSTTAALVPAGLAYLLVAVVYRVPVAVQPLKAFGAVAIAAGAGPDVIAAGALLMGAVFVVLALTGWLDRVARIFPRAVIRGVQLAVGLTFLRIAWGLVADPPSAFVRQPPAVPAALVAVVLVAVLVWRRGLVLVAVVGALVVAAALGSWDGWGPSVVVLPSLDAAAFATAAVLLVVPQLPLTFTNSCLAPPDAARAYFGDRAAAVTPSRLALTLGSTNLVVGALGGMPVCHGAGGMSAHHAAGGRTWRTPAIVGGALVVLAVAVGASLSGVLTAFPLPVLAALLVVAGLAHVRLLRDLSGRADWAVALVVGLLGMLNLAVAVLVGLVGAWAVRRWWS
jgi:hypothetical protein